MLESILSYVDMYARKWVAFQSRGAHAIDDAFLEWLHQRRPDRPFFAFLNYFDAHAAVYRPAGI